MMGKVSLIGRSLAKKGTVFTYIGRADECEKCKLMKICQDLVPGKRYEVTAVREKDHDCPVHETGKAVVVEVEEAPLEISIPSRKAMEGAVVELDMEGCPLRWCSNHGLCRREYFTKGQKVSLVKVDKELVCPRELKLKKAEVLLQD